MVLLYALVAWAVLIGGSILLASSNRLTDPWFYWRFRTPPLDGHSFFWGRIGALIFFRPFLGRSGRKKDVCE